MAPLKFIGVQATVMYSSNMDFAALMKRSDIGDFTPTWNEEKQRSYVLLATTELARTPFTFAERTGADPLMPLTYELLDGKERINAIRRHLAGELVICKSDLPLGSVGDGFYRSAIPRVLLDTANNGTSSDIGLLFWQFPAQPCVFLRNPTSAVITYALNMAHM